MNDKLSNEHIDFLCAKKIMNWDLIATGDGALGWQQWIDANSWTVTPQRIWRPSTNIADAWQVLEQFTFGQWATILGNSEDGWLCKIYGLGTEIDYSEASTAPMAICLAALKAVGVDVTEFA